jgi:hypothetical protein
MSLDDRIAIALRLLSQMRSLTPPELRTLATHLRVLSNIAEGKATHSEA